MPDSSRRDLPAIHSMLDRTSVRRLADEHGRSVVIDALRDVLGAIRTSIASNQAGDTSPESIERKLSEKVAEKVRGLSKVINATGILLHTGLGRAPLALEAIDAIRSVAAGYCDLEFDLATGERGSRTTVVEPLLSQLTGAESATVVNNNAAATILVLKALAFGREVIVSRGQLVEIGGSFRLPEIFESAGVTLREVGTTNKTRLSDYERAINPTTAAILRVHPSNFRVQGFTEAVGIAELAKLARSRQLWTIDDVGSGAMKADAHPALAEEPLISEGIRGGADVVLFSGDKLLGGPQCGIIVGKTSAIDRITSDPLMRALRVCKLTLAALESTLRLWQDSEKAMNRIPLWRFVTTPLPSLEERARLLAARIQASSGLQAVGSESVAYLGGGTLPTQSIASFAVRIDIPKACVIATEDQLASSLRRGHPAVVSRVQQGSVWLDLRAVDPQEDEIIARAVERVVADAASAR